MITQPANWNKVKPKKPFETYWVTLDGEIYETRARSLAEANVRARHQAGLAGNYDWHNVETDDIELAHTKIINYKEEY